MPVKSEIYTWRLSPATKARLEDAALVRGRSVAQLLDEVVSEGLDRAQQDTETEVDGQRRLHDRARRLSTGHDEIKLGRSRRARV